MMKKGKKVLCTIAGVAMAMALVVGFAVKDKTTASANANKRISVKDCAITLSETSFDYTGKEIKPNVRVNYKGQDLEQGVDYVVGYEDNIDAGEARVVVKGKGNYKSSATVKFKIVGIDFKSNCKVILDNSKRISVYYNGQQLTENKDYSVFSIKQETLIDQVPGVGGNLNTYEVTTFYTVSGKGVYSGSVMLTDKKTERRFEK